MHGLRPRGGPEATAPAPARPVRLASIADPAVLGLGGHYVFVRPDPDDLQDLTDLAERGALGVEVAAVFPLQKTADAQRLSMEGHARGKIAIAVD